MKRADPPRFAKRSLSSLLITISIYTCKENSRACQRSARRISHAGSWCKSGRYRQPEQFRRRRFDPCGQIVDPMHRSVRSSFQFLPGRQLAQELSARSHIRKRNSLLFSVRRKLISLFSSSGIPLAPRRASSPDNFASRPSVEETEKSAALSDRKRYSTARGQSR